MPYVVHPLVVGNILYIITKDVKKWPFQMPKSGTKIVRVVGMPLTKTGGSHYNA